MGQRYLEHWPSPADGWPAWLFTVPYVGHLHPQAPRQPIELGANCQRYAYAVLALFGRDVPPHRSSELWSEPQLEHPSAAAPLDLVLFNASTEAYGAHVAVWMADDQLLHLSQEENRPAVWAAGDFLRRPKYASQVGIVRAASRR